jgi:hypothetical protein
VKSYLLAVVLLPLLLLSWVAVQSAWLRLFYPNDADNDALAGRSDCGQCGCATPCDRRENERKQTRGNKP